MQNIKKNVKEHLSIHEPCTKKSIPHLKVLSLSALLFRDVGSLEITVISSEKEIIFLIFFACEIGKRKTHFT